MGGRGLCGGERRRRLGQIPWLFEQAVGSLRMRALCSHMCCKAASELRSCHTGTVEVRCQCRKVPDTLGDSGNNGS